eukprot:g571.t1
MATNKDTAIVFTRKGAYEITMAEAKKIEYKNKLASCENNLYYFDNVGVKQINHVEPENHVMTLHRRLGHASVELMEQLRKNGWIHFSDQDMKRFRSTPGGDANLFIPFRSLKLEENYKMSAEGRDKLVKKLKEEQDKDFVTQLREWDQCTMVFPRLRIHPMGLIPKSRKDRQLRQLGMLWDIRWRTISDMKKELADGLSLNSASGLFGSLKLPGEMAIWSDEFKSWCENNNIKRIRSASGEQNLAEMKIKVLKARAQKMCEEARDLPAHFEYLLYRHAAHLTNLLPSEPLMGRSPCQEYMGLDPSRALQRLKKFGSVAKSKSAKWKAGVGLEMVQHLVLAHSYSLVLRVVSRHPLAHSEKLHAKK